MLVCAFAGGDLHYHLSQHGVFSEKEMRFYAAEIILGLEHMHNRFVVYRDLKVWATGRPLSFCAQPRCRMRVCCKGAHSPFALQGASRFLPFLVSDNGKSFALLH